MEYESRSIKLLYTDPIWILQCSMLVRRGACGCSSTKKGIPRPLSPGKTVRNKHLNDEDKPQALDLVTVVLSTKKFPFQQCSIFWLFMTPVSACRLQLSLCWGNFIFTITQQGFWSSDSCQTEKLLIWSGKKLLRTIRIRLACYDFDDIRICQPGWTFLIFALVCRPSLSGQSRTRQWSEPSWIRRWRVFSSSRPRSSPSGSYSRDSSGQQGHYSPSCLPVFLLFFTSFFQLFLSFSTAFPSFSLQLFAFFLYPTFFPQFLYSFFPFVLQIFPSFSKAFPQHWLC